MSTASEKNLSKPIEKGVCCYPEFSIESFSFSRSIFIFPDFRKLLLGLRWANATKNFKKRVKKID